MPRRNLDDCIIRFDWSIDFLKMFFKALVRPYPLPMLSLNGKLYEITSASFLDREYFTHLGRVVNIDDLGVYIKVNGGLFIIESMKEYDTGKEIVPQKFFKLGKRLWK